MQDEERKGGVVFKNSAKVAESQPDWLGKVTIEGKAYSVALWEKNSMRTGVPFMSLAFRPEPSEPPSLEDLASELNDRVVAFRKRLELERPDLHAMDFAELGGTAIWKMRNALDGIYL